MPPPDPTDPAIPSQPAGSPDDPVPARPRERTRTARPRTTAEAAARPVARARTTATPPPAGADGPGTGPADGTPATEGDTDEVPARPTDPRTERPGRVPGVVGGVADPRTASPTARRRARVGVAVAVAGAVVAGAATALAVGGGGSHPARGAGPAGGRARSAGPARTAVDVSVCTCGRGWTRPQAGPQVFDLLNSGAVATDVDLVDPATGKVYGEMEGLAPGRTRSMTVDLGSGTYAFRCLQEDAEAVTGPTVTVPGSRPRGPAALPVTQHDLIPPTLAYQRWIGDRMTELAHGTATLKADIDRGDLAAARRDWLTTHLVYARMGAAYGTFGAADGVIDGVASRTPGGVHAASFTGFHRVEYGLWHGESARALTGPAARLDGAVRALRNSWAQARMDPADLGLRAHEILEDTAQFELTGRSDYGSGTSLATARADLDGTREILSLLHPLLAARDPRLPHLDAALGRLQGALDAEHHGGTWTAVAGLPRQARERIDAATGAALEDLARVAAIFDVRRTA